MGHHSADHAIVHVPLSQGQLVAYTLNLVYSLFIYLKLYYEQI